MYTVVESLQKITYDVCGTSMTVRPFSVSWFAWCCHMLILIWRFAVYAATVVAARVTSPPSSRCSHTCAKYIDQSRPADCQPSSCVPYARRPTHKTPSAIDTWRTCINQCNRSGGNHACCMGRSPNRSGANHACCMGRSLTVVQMSDLD